MLTEVILSRFWQYMPVENIFVHKLSQTMWQWKAKKPWLREKPIVWTHSHRVSSKLKRWGMNWEWGQGLCTDPAEHQAHSPPGEGNPHSRTGWGTPKGRTALQESHWEFGKQKVTTTVPCALLAEVDSHTQPVAPAQWPGAQGKWLLSFWHLWPGLGSSNLHPDTAEQVCGEPTPQVRSGAQRHNGVCSAWRR